VVDGACFATEVTGLGTDYRFDGSTAYRECAVPSEIAELCSAVAAREGLLLAGFDFRVDSRGTRYCLEVNPMPSFIAYEWATGQPIAEALVDDFARRMELQPAP
jgi:glutathione synthase/RimK-type ligase-like ATP-grasp enzyme